MTSPFKRKYDYQAVYQYIVDYKKAHDGNSPSYKQIQEAFGIKSFSNVRYIMERLQDIGLIVLPEQKYGRGIRVVGGKWDKD